MEEFLKIIDSLAMLSLFIHSFLLSFHNKSRIRKLLNYLEIFKNTEKLSPSDYNYLKRRYTGFFSYLEFYPDKEDFKALYEDTDFNSYIKRSKWKMKYYSIAVAISFSIAIFTTFYGSTI